MRFFLTFRAVRSVRYSAFPRSIIIRDVDSVRSLSARGRPHRSGKRGFNLVVVGSRSRTMEIVKTEPQAPGESASVGSWLSRLLQASHPASDRVDLADFQSCLDRKELEWQFEACRKTAPDTHSIQLSFECVIEAILPPSAPTPEWRRLRGRLLQCRRAVLTMTDGGSFDPAKHGQPTNRYYLTVLFA